MVAAPWPIKEVNPCCCLNLKTGSALIGIFELVLWSLILAWTTLSLWTVIGVMNETHMDTDLAFEFPEDTAVTDVPIVVIDQDENPIHRVYVMLLIGTVACIVRLLNSALLILGVLKGSVPLVKIWLGIKIFTVVLTLAGFTTTLINDSASVELDVIYGFNLFISLYFIWVIIALIGVLKPKEQLVYTQEKV